MDDKSLEELRAKVTAAEKLKQQIVTLEEFIASCNAEVGFLNVTMNYRNQNEIKLVTHFGAKEVFDAFRDDLRTAAEKLKAKLEADYNNLK